jgi:hypothetical protein
MVTINDGFAIIEVDDATLVFGDNVIQFPEGIEFIDTDYKFSIKAPLTDAEEVEDSRTTTSVTVKANDDSSPLCYYAAGYIKTGFNVEV